MQWDGGVGVHDLVRGRLSWASQLPMSLLAASARSCRLAVGTPSGSLVLLDADGRASSAQGVLHGLGVQAAEFYSVPHLAPGEVGCLPWLAVERSGMPAWGTDGMAATQYGAGRFDNGFAMPPIHRLQGSTAPVLLVLNDARQYAACLPTPLPPSQRAPGGGIERSTASRPATVGAATPTGQPLAPTAAGLASAAAGLELSASHLLPPATELCERCLESLLL